MDKVYVSHSKDFDFKNELYLPLRNSHLNNEFEFILPHEQSDTLFSSKDFLKNECDIIVVEASYPKLGVGIEVGWADAYEIPIIAMYKKDFKLSPSIQSLSKEIIEYSSKEEMISKLGSALKNH